MKSFLEIGPDGYVIEWREHPLTEAVLARASAGLDMEPVLHPPGSFTELQLTPKETQHKVCWTWGGRWARVDLRPLGLSGPPMKVTRDQRDAPSVGWDELSFCDAVELTPYDAQGNAGATVRRERPLVLTSQDIEYERVGSSKLRLRLRGRGPWQNLGVRLRWTGGHRTPPQRFNQDGIVDIPLRVQYRDDSFRGTIVVVHLRGEGERLVHCFGWLSKESREVSEEHRNEIRQEIEGGNLAAGPSAPAELYGWLDQWPQKSRGRLQRVYEEAAHRFGSDAAASHLRLSLAGLFRTVLLCNCGLEPEAALDQLIGHLNVGQWEEALGRISPQLPEALRAAPAAAEKLWVVANAQAAGLKEAVQWAGHHGVTALGRALDLVDLRRRAIELEALLRPDSDEGRDISQFVQEIEDAPIRVTPVEPLHERFAKIEQEVRRQETCHQDPDGPPPPSREAYMRWLTKCRLRQHWRLQLARVLTYSERGEWAAHEPARDRPEFTVEELMWRLGRVEEPNVRSLTGRLPAVTDEVQAVGQCINQLLQESENETSETLRALAQRQLTYAILPNATVWAPLYHELRRVEEQARQFTWFAACAGVNGHATGLNARVAAAQKFIDLVEALEARLAAWAGGRLAQAAGGLRAVLSAPTHPLVAETYARAKELKGLLSPTEYADDISLPESVPAPPSAPSVEQLGEWWGALHDLEASLALLESRMARFAADAHTFREQFGAKIIDLIAHWRSHPPEGRPDYYDELRRLHALCSPPAQVRAEHLRALADLLDAHPRWRDDWENFARR